METFIINIKTKLTKEIYYFLWIIFLLAIIFPGIVLGEFSPAESGFPYTIQGQEYVEIDNAPTDLATELIAPDVEDDAGLLKTLSRFFRVTDTAYDDSETPATNYIKWLLNMLLGLVSFLALVMVMFAFYLIFFSKWEEALTKAKKILIGVAIALAIMWLSWFIASFFFDIYGTVTAI